MKPVAVILSGCGAAFGIERLVEQVLALRS